MTFSSSFPSSAGRLSAADAYPRVCQQAVQVIDPGHGLAIERNDHVTFAQSRFLSGLPG
jgi:hypothetical protein